MGESGFRCATWRSGGCTNRVASRFDICRTCRQEADEQVEDRLGEPSDFHKDLDLAEYGYGERPDGN